MTLSFQHQQKPIPLVNTIDHSKLRAEALPAYPHTVGSIWKREESGRLYVLCLTE